MIRIILLVVLVGLTLARPQQQQQQQREYGPRGGDREQRNEPTATILRSNSENNEDGSFSWDFETSDGTKVEQSGYLKNPGTEEEGIAIKGQYSYVEPEGGSILLRYTADENGFVPEGAHLPVAPEIPPEIQRALEIIYKNAKDQMTQERQRH